mgnify:CR=1 FL=1|tara:strand:- start:15698 stop:18052 length:2355 start_codon:yes stop_codon:yes gene_type:complete
MSTRTGKSVQFYYVSILFVTMLALVAGSWWFWSKGPSHGSKVAEVFEAGLMMDRLSDSKNINEVEMLVASDQVRQAVKKLAALESDAQTISRVADVDPSLKLKESSEKLREQMHKLIEYPELSSIFLVLANKMSTFENFVVQNQWRTLTRLSRRVNARLEPAKLRSPGFFQYSKLVQTVGGVREDVSQMKQVTTGSVLSQNDKNSILNRLSTMDSELDMLGKYVDSYQTFMPAFTTYKNEWNLWTTQASPSLAKLRLEQERVSQWILYGVIGLFSFLMCAAVVGVTLNRRENKKASKAWEHETVQLLRDRLLPTDGSESKKWSRDFALEFSKYREYVHKRMSFGTIFQEATPFGAFLLDSNLGLVWANNLFWKCWNLETQNESESNVSWDYLQGFTNLGEDDPVLLALKQGIAGIYQIQIKAQGQEETAPYEMYVSPVDYAGQKRVMIFLYPLHTVEESLAQQTKSVVGPAIKALESIAAREFEGEGKTRLESQFVSAGIEDLFGQFDQFNMNLSDRIESLEGEIAYLRSELDSSRGLVQTAKEKSIDSVATIDQAVNSFEKVKDSLISSIDYRYELERLYSDTVTTAKALFKDEEQLLNGAMSVNELLGENQKATTSVAKVREQLRDIKTQFDEGRSRLSQSVDQALVFAKRDESGGSFEAPLHKIRGEARAFDQAQTGLGQALKSLDVSLSKMEMILDDHKAPDFSGLKRNFEEARARIESDMFKVGKLGREGEMTDERVVGSLKTLFADFQKSRATLLALKKTVSVSKSNTEVKPEVSVTQ